ncbi:MAG: DUF72 domain-containing protein [Burkholderiales bacterium]|nr:DUF72 domain-containing protein [Burkholderiales bacterium]
MTTQFDLFGADAVPPATSSARSGPSRPVAPAAPEARVAALGRALPARLYLGTSSWAFPGWAGIVYDRAAPEGELARDGLRAYAAHPLLRCVGVDRTYYATLAASDFARYAAQVPAAFRFVVKGPALVTDPFIRAARGRPAGENPRFLDAHFTAAHCVAPYLEGLGANAGPLFFQFPPLGRTWVRDPARFAARLHRFLAALPAGPTYAVEVRDAELVGEALAAALDAAGARYCFGVHPRLPDLDAQAACMLRPGPFVARWNLRGGLAYEQARARYAPFDRLVEPDPGTRGALARLCARALADGAPAFVVANNKAEGSAPLTLVALAGEIVALAAERGAGAP